MASPSIMSTETDQTLRHNSDVVTDKIESYKDEPQSPTKAYIPTNRDPEKALSRHSDVTLSSQHARTHAAAQTWQNVPAVEQSEHLTTTLIYLSTINPLVATLFSFYAILIVLLTLVFGFFQRIGKESISLQDQIIKVLAPAIRFELRLIRTDVNLYSRSPLSTRRLMGILLLSPWTALPLLLAAWTAAMFWIYTTILGEPNEKQGKEVDGRSAARWVKSTWERWLLLGL